MSGSEIVLKPIGFVSSPRSDLSDDHWGSVESTIALDFEVISKDALLELEEFSHLEVVYYFHRVASDDIDRGARHPRGNREWPRAGILAQRAKHRPNRLGVSRCQLLSIATGILRVRGLDAIDGTPVLDIKPYFVEFGPIGEVRQPAWTHELMRDYYL